MKILHTVEFYAPNVGGAQEVVKQLSERMAAKGHDVTVATSALPDRKSTIISGVKIIEFDISGNTIRGFSGDVENYKKFLVESDFDVIMNYAAQQWTADIFFAVMDRVKGHKVLVPCGFSNLYDPAYAAYFEKMPDILRQYDATVYMSGHYRDIDFARAEGVHNTRLIPNGANEDEFNDISEKARTAFRKRSGFKPGEILVVNVSNHTGEKGHYEMLATFLLAPFRNARFCLISGAHGGCSRYCKLIAKAINSLSWLTGRRVDVLFLDRTQTVTAMKAADIFLFLSNIEASPLVLFEAAAAGVPFISTTAGNASEIAEWTGGLIVPTKDIGNGRVRAKLLPASRILASLGRDKNRRLALGEAGRQAWEARFTWSKLTDQYLALYTELVKESK